MKQTFASEREQLWKCLILAGCLLPGSASAQLTTDQVPRGRTVPTPEEVKQELEKSRFRFGPIRLIPTLLLSDAGYDSNVFGAFEKDEAKRVADWTATVTAGARWVLPLGSKGYLRGAALPEYIWYRDLTARRTFGGSYQASLLGFFNRLSVEVGGYTAKTFEFPNSESETRVVQNARDGLANLEVELSRPLSVFAKVEVQRLRFTGGGEAAVGLDVTRFDRTEGAARGGVRYRISPAWDISGAVEGTRTEFVKTPEERDNQSAAYVLGVHCDLPRFFVNLSGGYRKIRPYNNSSLRGSSTPTGSYFASYFLTRNLELRLYGGRRVVYGFRDITTPYFFETRNGGGLNIQVHPRLLLRGFGEYGKNDSPFAARTDTVTYVGGGFSVSLFRKAVFTALASRATYRSNTSDLARSVFRFTTGLTFEGELSR